MLTLSASERPTRPGYSQKEIKTKWKKTTKIQTGPPVPTSPNGANGKGILGLYGGNDRAGGKYRQLVNKTGQLVGATMDTLRNAVEAGEYSPENGAEYPDGSLGRKLREAAMLMKRTPVKILGLNIGGWDTHESQGQTGGQHTRLLGYLAQGFQALYRDLQSQWDDLLIVTMTEFGRTSKENGSQSTDHAESSVVFVGGGAVNGGVYNCDSRSWTTGDMFKSEGRYLERATDFRSVYGEIFKNYFQDDDAMLEQIIPGYGVAKQENLSDFRPLNIV